MSTRILTLLLCLAGPAPAPLGAAPPPPPVSPATEVEVGIYVININAIDLQTNIYRADFYLWFKWKGDIDPSQTFEFINTVERWGTTKEPVYETPLELPGGYRYQQLRVQALFNEKFPLNAYPLDHQTLLIQLEDAHHSDNVLRYSVDVEESGVDSELRLPGFEIRRHRIQVRHKTYPTRFGIPPEVEAPGSYSRVEYRLDLDRPFASSTFKMILPVLIVLLSTLCVFWLPPEQIDSRVGLAITALLSAVALHITAVSNLPAVSYLVLIDKIYNLTYILVFMTLVAVIASLRLVEAGRQAQALRLESWCARLFPLVFVAGTTALILLR